MRATVRMALGGVVFVALGRVAAVGKLPRNLFAGIRIPSTLRSDEAWRAGHLAAASALTIAGLGPIAVAAIMRSTGLRRGFLPAATTAAVTRP